MIDVRKMANLYAFKNNIENQFTNEVAGRTWLDHFSGQHRDTLSLHTSMRTSYARVQGFNRDAVKEFFDILEAELGKTNSPSKRIFNVDEKGLTIV